MKHDVIDTAMEEFVESLTALGLFRETPAPRQG